MLHLFVSRYYKLFDETISSSTVVVALIAILVMLVGYMAPVSAESVDLYSAGEQESVVLIDGKRYKLSLSPIDSDLQK